jgi:hypothetical protein
MSLSLKTKLSLGQRIAAGCFGLLGVAFLVRSGFFATQWLRHVVEGDTNFKALTIWTLAYAVVCGVIAFVIVRTPREEDDERDAASASRG